MRPTAGWPTAQYLRDTVQPVGQSDAARSRNQQPKGQGLRIPIGEDLVGRIGEQHLAPGGGQSSERWTARCQMLRHFVPQETAQAGGLLGELLRGAGRLGFPQQERWFNALFGVWG